MPEATKSIAGMPFDLAEHVAYAEDAVVSKTVLKKDTGTITLFAFDAGQGLSEHTAPFDATVVAKLLLRRLLGGCEVSPEVSGLSWAGWATVASIFQPLVAGISTLPACQLASP